MTTELDFEQQIHYVPKPEGPIAAAILAAGVGSAALGLFTTLAEASPAVKEGLAWSKAVGPLSGKTIGAVIVWLVAWLVLHLRLRTSAYETRRALTIALGLIGLGVLGTFPIFFQLFG
ncbi:hypothetical protein [Nonomuraea basaltis]|uniref:hypothetical protein n=1 Tax=Nonomuraea basaltis TaxID=2495887 RepID=UPI00110C3FA8|nr:hypothetical protein [Nonomuraea basaltis]TMR95449.1 hypothetical protein EJK15_28495 [Nonomuraea basaltis]